MVADMSRSFDPAIHDQLSKPCKNGHVGFRYKSNGACVECQESRRKRYRAGGGRAKETVKQKERYQADPAAGAAAARERRNVKKSNESCLKWRSNNKVAVKRYSAVYVRKNRDMKAANAAVYTARKLRATPAWADHKKIKKIYRLAKDLTDLIGEQYEVDHIVPLRGKYVCGLHVENNLRAIPANENRRKYNTMVEL